MKDFLKGLLLLSFVHVGVFAIYWIGVILVAVVGGIMGVVIG